MPTERDRILKMVEDGTINAAEANELLGAMGNAALVTRGAPDVIGNGAAAPANPPWEAPFVAGIVLSGFGLLGLMRRRANIFGRMGAWLTLILGLAAAAVGFWSRNAPWLHINVQEKDGNNIHIMLPLLLPVARAALNVARGFVDAAMAEQLDTAAAFLDALERSEQSEPVSVEVDDGNGAQVLIYVG